MDKSDDELIAEFNNGNSDSLTLLIERYSGQLYRFAYRMTGKASESEDIVQETFVKIWKTLSSYRMENSFKPWAFTVARNTVIDYMRKKKFPVVSDFDLEDGKNYLIETVVDNETIPASLIEKAEDKKLLEKGLQNISVEDREIIVLHYEEDMTFEAIGKVLNKPLNTVKSRHRRALIKLRESFENEAGFEQSAPKT